jgi:hypothetical protein
MQRISIFKLKERKNNPTAWIMGKIILIKPAILNNGMEVEETEKKKSICPFAAQ